MLLEHHFLISKWITDTLFMDATSTTWINMNDLEWDIFSAVPIEWFFFHRLWSLIELMLNYTCITTSFFLLLLLPTSTGVGSWGCYSPITVTPVPTNVLPTMGAIWMRITVDVVGGTCWCFLHRQIIGSIISRDSSFEVVSRTTKKTSVYPGLGPSMEVIARRPVGWYSVKIGVTRGEKSARMVRVLKGV
jgi:hypothetical protein